MNELPQLGRRHVRSCAGWGLGKTFLEVRAGQPCVGATRGIEQAAAPELPDVDLAGVLAGAKLLDAPRLARASAGRGGASPTMCLGQQ